MPVRFKIEMQTPEETELLHTLPTLSEIPEMGRPVHMPGAMEALNKTKKDGAGEGKGSTFSPATGSRLPGGDDPATPAPSASSASPTSSEPSPVGTVGTVDTMDDEAAGAAGAGAGAAGAAGGGKRGGTLAEPYEAKENALMASMRALGHPIMRVSGRRTAEEQAKLFAKGSSTTEKSGAPGDESRHQLGMAGDYAFIGPNGQPDFSQSQPWDTLGRMAKIHGLDWGGDWETLKDLGHIQLADPDVVAKRPTPAQMQSMGLLVHGNIDLDGLPQVENPDGTISTVRSISANINGREVLIPTVIDGEVVSNAEAIKEYRRTGKHLGIFDTPAHANAFAQQLHESEAQKLNAQSDAPASTVPAPVAAPVPAPVPAQAAAPAPAAAAAPAAVTPTPVSVPVTTPPTAPPTAPTAPSSGGNRFVVETMTPEDQKKAAQLPVWRQILDPIMEQAPFITGATGGMIAGTAALPTAAVSGPVGPATAAMGGAYAGGLMGDAIRQTYRHWTGQDLSDRMTAVQRMDSMSAAGRSQMYQEAVGQGLKMYFAARQAAKVATGAFADLATSQQYKLNLSAADISRSPTMRTLANWTNYISQSARAATAYARSTGQSNAVKAVQRALDAIGPEMANADVGAEVVAGVKAGRQGLRGGTINAAFEAAKANGPTIDLRPLLTELYATFQREGTPAAARQAILRLVPATLSPIGDKTMAEALAGSDPYHITFEQAARLRSALGDKGRKVAEIVGTNATSLATKLYGELSDTLTAAYPQFAKASSAYRTARAAVANKFVKETLTTSPDKIVQALGRTPGVQTIVALRRTMTELATDLGPNSPQAQAGQKGWQTLRRSWFDKHILRDASGVPDPLGMVERMRKANGVIQAFYGSDPEGQQVIQTAKDIGAAFQRYVKMPEHVLGQAWKYGEFGAILTSVLKLGYGTGLAHITAEEVVPGLVTWAMHRPKIAKMIVQGLAGGTVQNAVLLARAIGAYAASGGPEADPEPASGVDDLENLPAYDPNAKPTASTGQGTPGAVGTSGQSGQSGQSDSPVGLGTGVGLDTPDPAHDPMTGAPITLSRFDPKVAAKRKADAAAAAALREKVRQASIGRDPMEGGVPIMVGDYDPFAVPEGPNGGMAPYPSTPRSQIKPELQPKRQLSFGPTGTQPIYHGAQKISAGPMDAMGAELANREETDPIAPITATAKAIGDKIRQWGETSGEAMGSRSEDPTIAAMGAGWQGGSEGLAQWVEGQFSAENIALSMVPIHELAELEQLTRSFGPSAEGFPGLYSRLTRGVEALQTNRLGMVSGKKVTDLLRTMNPDEVAWKEVVPWLRERMGNNPQTLINKAELLAHLKKNKINLRVKSTGEPSHIPLSLREKVSYGDALDQAGSDQGYSARINSGDRYIGDAKVYPVNYEGEEPRWQAMVPRNYMNQGLPHDYTIPEGTTLGTYGDTATFDTKQDAENWLNARISMGARDPDAHTPQFENLYALPGEPPAEGKNYRETRILMPGGEGEGQNPKLDPKTFRVTSHYPDYNPVSTTRGQDYSLPRWKVEGLPDPATVDIPGETPNERFARVQEMSQPVRGNIADEYQADIHEEALNARNKVLEDARNEEIARRVNKAHDEHVTSTGRSFPASDETALKKSLDKSLPENLFDKPHIEIRDGDQNDKVIKRFLTQDEADRWLSVEGNAFQNARAVPVKGVDPLTGYQSISSKDPQYRALKDDVASATNLHDKLYQEEHALRDALGEARIAGKDRMAVERGYADYDEIYRKTHYSSVSTEERAKARLDSRQINDAIEQDPAVLQAEARRRAKDIQTDEAEKVMKDASRKLEQYHVRTGNWSMYENVPVPDMPFKDDKAWAGLGMKHEILKHSAMYPEETTFIGHAGGKENADRYNLMYHFDKVRYNPEEKELEIYKNGRKVQSYDMPEPSARELRRFMGPELADRLMEKIEAYEPETRDVDDSGLPGTESERNYAEEQDRQSQWDQEYEHQRNNHTVESYDRPVLDADDQPVLDEDGEPETEERWRWFQDDQFDEDDPDTWHDYTTERLADRGLERELESIMDGWEYEPSDDVYDHLDPPESEIDPEAHPTLEGLDLSTGGEGMVSFYDNKVKRWMEQLLAPFGGDAEMRKIAVPGKKGESYMWITRLTPEMKAKILKTGFSLMALSLAVRESNAPQSVKDAIMAIARKDTMHRRQSQQRRQPQFQ